MTLHSAFFVATLSCCFSTAHVVASMFVRDGFRPLGCSRFLSFNELNISAMIALRFWYVVIDSFIQEAPLAGPLVLLHICELVHFVIQSVYEILVCDLTENRTPIPSLRSLCPNR